MKIKSFGAGLLTLALAGTLCSCDNTEIRSVTLPRVSTKGITAFVYTGEETKEAEETEEAEETAVGSHRERHGAGRENRRVRKDEEYGKQYG